MCLVDRAVIFIKSLQLLSERLSERGKMKIAEESPERFNRKISIRINFACSLQHRHVFHIILELFSLFKEHIGRGRNFKLKDDSTFSGISFIKKSKVDCTTDEA